mmetsp:Transcript_81652/g.119651  ORF Transcript_81652/g.119651 Transcript_81652/m.119651 type:complete len:242 (+) Transcript_81652:18-743(+)|eukprot:CAMPEP_0173097360 /NCGR_PEP_ID=MMETSP1102-20130122/33822_1 /TAXON_ID=49646 /ORGANISM="Geminigera sp., Strain Caron Lab Isolate" /LENGTH=241 /DNA_ID=CAMNT_0013989117 /DNA_START=18 /DNA_END=743 /DNA_ORIENTATION=+
MARFAKLVLCGLAATTNVQAFCAPALSNLLPQRHLSGAARAASSSGLLATQAGLTLYGSRGSRSPLIEWYLVEIKKEYTHEENKAGNPNPFGQIPGLTDDTGVEMFESGAILMYIADKYGGLDTPEARATMSKWVLWANSALDPVLFTRDIEARAPALLKKLNGVLEGKEYLEQNTFSVADVAVCSYLLFIPLFHPSFDASRFPNVVRYMARCADRPAYQSAFGANSERAIAYVKAQAAKC